jgi:inhibitor of cysteine peptidase
MEIAMKRILVSLVVTILLTGCASSSFTPTPTLLPTAERQSTLPEPTDHTQLIIVKAGETFELMLPSNPSTGYHWEIIPELNENIVQFVSQDYIPEQPVKPGSGGVDVWTFRGINPGDTTVVLGYYPPADTNDPEEVVTFSIHVE